MKQPIPNNLRYYREKLGVIGKELEWRTGISDRQWPHYEAGREPKVSLAQKFVKVYNEIAKEKAADIKKLTVDDLYPPQE